MASAAQQSGLTAETARSEPAEDAAPSAGAALDRLRATLFELTPEQQKAAAHILENPSSLGLASVRELAAAAGVKPNTMVRLARRMGFDGYDALRAPFREALEDAPLQFHDRARSLQNLSASGRLGWLQEAMAAAAADNIAELARRTAPHSLEAAARAILAAERRFVLGVGVAQPAAATFAYTLGMALDGVAALPDAGGLPIDGLARARAGDVLIAMTFRPFRREVVEAAALARREGLTIIGISDSEAAPILHGAAHRFIAPTDSPQFFTSTVALTALLEMLAAHVVAEAGAGVVAAIDKFHERRHSLGVYLEEGDAQR